MPRVFKIRKDKAVFIEKHSIISEQFLGPLKSPPSNLLQTIELKAKDWILFLKNCEDDTYDEVETRYFITLIFIWIITLFDDTNGKLKRLMRCLKIQDGDRFEFEHKSMRPKQADKPGKNPGPVVFGQSGVSQEIKTLEEVVRKHYARVCRDVYLKKVIKEHAMLDQLLKKRIQNKRSVSFLDGCEWKLDVLQNKMDILFDILDIYEEIMRDEGHGQVGDNPDFNDFVRLLHKLKYYISADNMTSINDIKKQKRAKQLLILDNKIKSLVDCFLDLNEDMPYNIISSDDSVTCDDCEALCFDKARHQEYEENTNVNYKDGMNDDPVLLNMICFKDFYNHILKDTAETLPEKIQNYLEKLTIGSLFPFDAVILDIYLDDYVFPNIGMNGIDILASIEKAGITSSDLLRPPLIMLSSYNDNQHYFRAFNAKADWFVTKRWRPGGPPKLLEESFWDLISATHALFLKKDIVLGYFKTLNKTAEVLKAIVENHPYQRFDPSLKTMEIILKDLDDILKVTFPTGSVPRFLYKFYNIMIDINEDMKKILYHYCRFEWVDVRDYANNIISSMAKIGSSEDDSDIEENLNPLDPSLLSYSNPGPDNEVDNFNVSKLKINMREIVNILTYRIKKWPFLEDEETFNGWRTS